MLRANAEAENPSLKDKKKLVPSKRRKCKRRIRKVVIPVFDDRHPVDGERADRERRSGTDDGGGNDDLQKGQDELRKVEQAMVRCRQLIIPSEGRVAAQNNSQVSNNNSGSSKASCSGDDKTASVSNSNKKTSSSDESKRTSSSNDSRRESQSDSENSRRGSLAEASDSGRSSQSEATNYNKTLARKRKELLAREANILFNLEYFRTKDNTPSEAMDTTEADNLEAQNVNSEAAEEQGASKTEGSVSGVSPQHTGNPGVGNGDSGIDNISDDSVPEESSSDPEKTETEPISASIVIATGTSHDTRRCPPYLKRSAEENDDEEADNPPPLGGPRHSGKCCRKAVIFKRIAYSDVDSDDFDEFESDSGKESFPKDYEGTREKSDLSCYTYHMKQKINLLPLPHPLKMFLNFSRPV